MLNKVTLIGHVGFSETIVLSNGMKRTKLSIATREWTKDKDGKKLERTNWISVQAFQKLAEIMETMVTKGDLVYIEAKIQPTKYTDKAGVEHHVTNIIANEFKSLTPKGERDTSQQHENRGNVKEVVPLDDDIPW